VQLFTETQPIDLLTVSAQLKKNAKLDLAGDFYLIQLTKNIINILSFTQDYSTKFIQRSLIQSLIWSYGRG
jgi:replicative DNA helicase